MIGAGIRNGEKTLVIDLPTGMMELQTKLSSVGIDRTAENINLSGEDGDRIRVKLYATEPEEAHTALHRVPTSSVGIRRSSPEISARRPRSARAP